MNYLLFGVEGGGEEEKRKTFGNALAHQGNYVNCLQPSLLCENVLPRGPTWGKALIKIQLKLCI